MNSTGLTIDFHHEPARPLHKNFCFTSGATLNRVSVNTTKTRSPIKENFYKQQLEPEYNTFRCHKTTTKLLPELRHDILKNTFGDKLNKELNIASEREILPERRGRVNPWRGNERLLSQRFAEDIDAAAIDLRQEYMKIKKEEIARQIKREMEAEILRKMQ